MALKGQTLVFENVIIFSIGVTMFIFSFVMFLNLQEYYRAVAIHDHMNKLENVLVANVIYVATSDEINVSVIVEIPETIGGEFYTVGFEDEKLYVDLESATVKKTSGLFNLGEDFDIVTGSIVSNRGKATIYKNGDRINIL